MDFRRHARPKLKQDDGSCVRGLDFDAVEANAQEYRSGVEIIVHSERRDH